MSPLNSRVEIVTPRWWCKVCGRWGLQGKPRWNPSPASPRLHLWTRKQPPPDTGCAGPWSWASSLPNGEELFSVAHEHPQGMGSHWSSGMEDKDWDPDAAGQVRKCGRWPWEDTPSWTRAPLRLCLSWSLQWPLDNDPWFPLRPLSRLIPTLPKNPKVRHPGRLLGGLQFAPPGSFQWLPGLLSSGHLLPPPGQTCASLCPPLPGSWAARAGSPAEAGVRHGADI